MQAKQLIIYIHDHTASSISWIMLNADTHESTEPKTGTLADIPRVDTSVTVIVFIPTIDTLILPVTLPNMPASQRAQAALFTLEEQLADDIQDLHAAVLGPSDDHEYHVIIIKKDLLKSWVDKLQSFQITPTIMLPEVFALPGDEHEWTIAVTHEMTWVRTANEMGLAIEGNLIQPILADLIVSQGITVKPITVYNFTQQDIAQQLAFLGQKIDVVADGDKSFAGYLLLNINPENLPGNLLQGDFSPTVQFKSQRKKWRVTAIIAVALLFTILISVVTQWIYLNHQDKILQQQIATLYRKVFPQATNIISPKFRIQEELNKQSHILNETGFLYLLAIAGQAMNDISGITIQNLSYNNNQLTVTVQANSTQALDKISLSLKTKPISFRQSNTQSSGTTITSDFILTRSQS